MMNEIDTSYLPFMPSSNQSFNQLNFSSSYALDDPLLYDTMNTSITQLTNEELLTKASKAVTKQPSKPSTTTQASSPPSSNARIKGNSCHQCKTTKESKVLYFCTARTDQPIDQSINHSTVNQARRCCRKKFCIACMNRWYKSMLHTGQPGLDPAANPSIPLQDEWLCPSCLDCCVCAACDRKKDKPTKNTSSNDSSSSSSSSSSKQSTKQATKQSNNHSSHQCKRDRSVLTPTLSGTNSPIPKTLKSEALTFEQSVQRSVHQLHKQLNQANNHTSTNPSNNPSIKLEPISELSMPALYGPRQVTDPSNYHSINQAMNQQLGRPPLVSRSTSANPAPIAPPSNRFWSSEAMNALNQYYQTVSQANKQTNNQSMDQSSAMSLLIEAQRANFHQQQLIQEFSKRKNAPIKPSTSDSSDSSYGPPMHPHYNKQSNHQVKREYSHERSSSISSMSSSDQSVNQYLHWIQQANHNFDTPPMTGLSSGSSQVSTPKTFSHSIQPSAIPSISHSIEQTNNRSIHDVASISLSPKSQLTNALPTFQPISHSIDRPNNISMNQSIPSIGQLFDSFSALVTPLCSMPSSPKHHAIIPTISLASSQTTDLDPFHSSSLFQSGLDCSLDDLCGDWSDPKGHAADWLFSNQ